MACARCWGHPAFGWLTLLLWSVVSSACAMGGAPPALEGVGDQVAEVGRELRIELRTSDSDGDDVALSFAADLGDLAGHAMIDRAPGGAGVFRWTPRASDVGIWHIDFVASDGAQQAVLTVRVDVRAAVGDRSAPRFRTPLGAGTTLDLTQGTCVDVDIAIDDQDSASVTLSEEEPRIDGASLEVTGGLSARWRWCPTAAQIAADDRYTLTLAARDATNPATLKSYLIVLRRPAPSGCAGDPPVVTHTAADAIAAGDLTIDARIVDDRGVGPAPLLYHTDQAPATPPDLTAMSPVEMILVEGTMRDGVWAADVPNPASAGGSATLSYAIVATDDDDPGGTCDHTATAPARGTYAMRVTRPAPPVTCRDDAFEENDTLIQAAARPALGAGTYSVTSCPLPGQQVADDDEDWYEIVLSASSTVTVDVAGGDATDLDLGLLDAAGVLVGASVGLTSVERISMCLRSGTYYVRAHAYGRARNDYRLTYARAQATCPAGLR
jgi:hypothetical protein